ncbi:Phenylalanine-4-hydroxylase [Intoshia linei]|uniref:Phenylalanine-4-hydroxylase n=1 Tax=Intoshia linei TaxID=1819745 RepID=A0A177B263_9BILA|nr:Phenylalanine-4-hydroxylase [Intoshia linei]
MRKANLVLKHASDLDYSFQNIISSKELTADHPGFHDKEYIKRRQDIAEISNRYKFGQELPIINYTNEENETWSKVFTALEPIYKSHACEKFNYHFKILQDEKIYKSVEDLVKGCYDMGAFSSGGIKCVVKVDGNINSIKYQTATKLCLNDHFFNIMDWPAVSPDLNPIENIWGIMVRCLYGGNKQYNNINELTKAVMYSWEKILDETSKAIPDFIAVSKILKKWSNMNIRPVAGYLSPRDFLAALAFRTFYCTQYIRHSKYPFYTPEPDCCHELLGHVPMLMDKKIADFSQMLGLASIGVSDEIVDDIATCYFFTIEFGLCKENEITKVYGAGLLSCKDELEFSLSKKAKIVEFEPKLTCKIPKSVTTFQECYTIIDSVDTALKLLNDYIDNLNLPYRYKYDDETKSIY